MKAWHEGTPTAEDLANTPYTVDDYADDYFEVWPANWQAFRVFADMDGQWRTGVNGLIAWDHTVLFRHLDDLELGKPERRALFDDLRVMESASRAFLTEAHNR